MPHHRRANHIRHQLVLVPVPRKQHRARTAAPIGLLHRDHLRVRQIDLVLQHARGPQNAQQVDALGLAQADQNLRRRLRLVARRAGQLPLLPLAVRKNLHLHAQRGLVVRIAGQVEAHKVILVRAHVAQQHRRRIQLRHNQVRRAVAVHIGGNQPARRAQLHSVQPQRVAHILKAAVAAIAKHPHPRPRPWSPQSPPGQSSHRCRCRSASRPIRAVASCSGSSTRSNRRPTSSGPATLRHSVSPGAPACVTAMSIQPSLL